MDPFIDMRRLILLLVLVSSAFCWPAPMTDDLNIGIDTQIAATASGNSSSVSGPAPQTIELSRKVNTTLAFLILLLVASTYWMLTTYTPKLSKDIWLPPAVLQPNVAAILSKVWLRSYKEPPGETTAPWVLFFPKKTDASLFTPKLSPNTEFWYHVEGYNEVSGPPSSFGPVGSQSNETQYDKTTTNTSTDGRVPIRFSTQSPVVNTMVQLCIWNFVGCWLVLVMIANTLVYNGFVNKSTKDDSTIRLILVLAYGFVNFAFQYRTSTLLYRNFTLIILEASWKIVFSTFVSIPQKDLQKLHDAKCFEENTPDYATSQFLIDNDLTWTDLSFELFGGISSPSSYRLIRPRKRFGVDRKTQMSHLYAPESVGHIRQFTTAHTSRDELRDVELKVYEKSTESALEKMLANVAVLLGICLATGLASWTSAVNNDSTTAQLGSYALLLSISTGFLALISVNSQLTIATESASAILLILEKRIETAFGDGSVVQTSSLLEMPMFGFSDGISAGAIPQKQPLQPLGL